MSQLIGLAGKMGVGKTTLAGLLGGARVAFADALKQEAAELYGFPVRWAYDGKDNTVVLPGGDRATVREVLQLHGAKKRAQIPGYWVRRLAETVRLLKWSDPSRIVIDDVRHKDEADWIREQGGRVFYLMPHELWRPGPFADHESETDLDDYEHFDACLEARFGELAGLAQVLEGVL